MTNFPSSDNRMPSDSTIENLAMYVKFPVQTPILYIHTQPVCSLYEKWSHSTCCKGKSVTRGHMNRVLNVVPQNGVMSIKRDTLKVSGCFANFNYTQLTTSSIFCIFTRDNMAPMSTKFVKQQDAVWQLSQFCSFFILPASSKLHLCTNYSPNLHIANLKYSLYYFAKKK